MSNLTIRVEGITLDYERADLNIKKENNALRSSFKVAHTSYPLRVINNNNAKIALGDLSIRSTTKRISYECEVIIGASVYNGVLDVKKPGNNQKFIEVDITFGSVLIALVDKKISDFLPSVNIKGQDPLQVPFSDQSLSVHNAQDLYSAQVSEYQLKVFPEVYYQYPQLNHPDRYDDTAADEDHRFYSKKVNARDYNTGVLLENFTRFENDEVVPYNLNVLSPQVFAMAPIVRAFESLGYAVAGTFVDHAIFNLLLFTSFEDQMTEVTILPPVTSYAISGNWESGLITFFEGFSPLITYLIKSRFPYPPEIGDYKMILEFDMTGHTDGFGFGFLCLDADGDSIGRIFQFEQEVITQEYFFSVTEENSDQDLDFIYYSQAQEFPTAYSIKVVPDVEDTTLYDMHPTIEFDRYVPDWNVIEAVNNFKNLFNLEVYIDDIEQVVYMNFNEHKLLSEDWYELQGNFRESGILAVSQEYFSLKMANDDDAMVLSSRDGILISTENPPNTTEIENKFKEVPYSNSTATLSEDLKDRAGQGLMIYNLIATPYIASSFAGVRLRMSGPDGLHENFWKVWLRYRLNASPLTISAPLTNTQIVLIEKLQRFYANNQRYIVDTMVIKDSGGLFLDVDLQVETVNF